VVVRLRGRPSYRSDVPVVAKIILPRMIHIAASYDLAQMNIDATTLFAGVEGVARSIHRHVLYFFDPEVLRLADGQGQRPNS
jgi:hypothetical protein